MAKRQIRDYVFSPGIAGAGTLKILDKVEVDQILLITNSTKNVFLYNFSDPTLPISTTFTSTTDGSDPDFPYSNTLSNGVTTITFLYDTTSHTSTDKIQIFVEAEEQRTRPYDFGTDAIERMRFAEPQSMLDADFEYGIQPTKWQSIDLLRGYPSIYEVPGSDIAVDTIVTDASQSSGGIGPSLITVDTALDHQLSVGDPISIKGLDDAVSGFSKAEGSFIVDSAPTATQFTYYAKAKVGTSAATPLKSTFTVLKEAGFYTGAAIGTGPSFAVSSAGASGTFSTRGQTPNLSTRLGVQTTSTLPPVGAPISGVGISSGTQITGVTDVDATLNITTSFAAPVSEIVFNDTSNIEIGAALDNGGGTTIYVTNIEGNTVTLSSPYTVSKTGNSINSDPTLGSTLNFGRGSGAGFDITRTKGSYSTVIINTSNFYNNIGSGTYTYSGVGSSANFNVERTGGASPAYTNVFVSAGGTGYTASETIVILGTDLNGTSPANDLTITISTVDGNGTITAISYVGTASAHLGSAGINYTAGEDFVVYGNSLGGLSPDNDLTIHVDSVGANGDITAFKTSGRGVNSSNTYSSVSPSSTSGIGFNALFNVVRTGSGQLIAQKDEVVVGGTIEVDDTFKITIDGTTDYTYTAVSEDTVTSVRNGLVSLINATSTTVIARTGATNGTLLLTSLTPGVGFACTILSEDAGGNALDTQTFSTQNITPNESTTTTPAYTVTVQNPGTAFANTDTITILGSTLGGVDSGNDLTITIQSVDANGAITAISSAGTAWNGDATFLNIIGNPVAFNATFIPKIVSGVYAPEISTGGVGYKVGYQVNINGSTIGGVSPANDLTITITSTDATGAVTQITSSGSPVSADALQFFPAVSISAPLTNLLGNTSTITYSAIARIEVDFASNHGLVPGDTIISSITSVGAGHDLISGPFFVDEVPSLDKIIYVARTVGTVSSGITGNIYPRTDCFYSHRPFDGGVQLGTGSPAHGAQSIRQSKKYIRYQSGKGIMYTSGALFAPSYDLRSVEADGTTVGSIITVVTDDLNHGLQVGAQIQLLGLNTSGYNNHYVVASVVDEITFTVIAVEELGSSSASFGDQPSVALYKWKGATVRAGAFDDQNGIFFQYDGNTIAVGLRSSTFQIAGTVTATPDSNELTGVNTKFTEQLSVGDRLVIRGMSHVITKIDNNSRLYMNPDFRGVSTATNVKSALTKEIVIPQNQWNIDRADGTGKSGYDMKINRMQMIGFQYSWYGAGFIDWMLRGPSGNFIFIHRLRNNNRNNEAFMRSGNLPVRYEVINEGAKGKLSSALTNTEVESLTLKDSSLFPDSGIVLINNELIRYTSNASNVLSGLTRSATYTNFAAGAQRTYIAGSATSHENNTGVVLLSNTATPQINHWGSAFITDGGFDEDRGYLFNYQEKEIEITTSKSTLFLIRLSPSVSNAITGDLGERELINRAQLLLKNLEITTQGGSSSQGVIIEGVLNPRNYPTDPADVTWAGLNTGGSGGQPSFAQIASGGDITFIGGTSPVTATNAINQNYSTNYPIFNRADIAGVQIGHQVTGADLKGGVTVVNFYNRNSSQVFVQLSDRTRPGTAGSSSYVFEQLTGAATPGEQVFAFTASPGNRDAIDLTELKELTNTPIGGRGTFPNGPDVLAINAYLTSGSAINATINIRWSEAQA